MARGTTATSHHPTARHHQAKRANGLCQKLYSQSNTCLFSWTYPVDEAGLRGITCAPVTIHPLKVMSQHLRIRPHTRCSLHSTKLPPNGRATSLLVNAFECLRLGFRASTAFHRVALADFRAGTPPRAETRAQELAPSKALPRLLAAAIATGALYQWLWSGDRQIFALGLSMFLLLSGGLLLSSRHATFSALVLGAAIGALAGSAIGIGFN